MGGLAFDEQVVATGAIAFGDYVAAAANGTVSTWVNAIAGAVSTTHTIIGKCVDPAGIANGARGKIVLGQVGMG